MKIALLYIDSIVVYPKACFILYIQYRKLQNNLAFSKKCLFDLVVGQIIKGVKVIINGIFHVIYELSVRYELLESGFPCLQWYFRIISLKKLGNAANRN